MVASFTRVEIGARSHFGDVHGAIGAIVAALAVAGPTVWTALLSVHRHMELLTVMVALIQVSLTNVVSLCDCHCRSLQTFDADLFGFLQVWLNVSVCGYFDVCHRFSVVQ